MTHLHSSPTTFENISAYFTVALNFNAENESPFLKMPSLKPFLNKARKAKEFATNPQFKNA